MKPIGIAVVGLGTIVEAVHLPALRRLTSHYQLRAVCDLSSARANFVARHAGQDVLATTDPEAAIDCPGVEAVFLLHSGAHDRLSALALDAGRHVFAEKPLTMSRREALALDERAAKAGLALQVGYMKMYDPAVEEARRAIDQLSGVHLVRVTVLHPDERHQFAHLRRIPPADDVDEGALQAEIAHDRKRTTEALGNVPDWVATFYAEVLNGSVIHELSLLRALGLPLPSRFEHVAAWPGGPPDPPPNPPCIDAFAVLSEETRLSLNWNFLPDYANYSEELAVFAEGGRVFLDLAPPYLLDARSTLRVERSEGKLRRVTTSFGSFESGFLIQLEQFAASVREVRPVRSTAAGAADDIACLLAMTKRLAAGYSITFGGEAAVA